MSILKKTGMILLFIFAVLSSTRGQELDATVKVSLEKLPEMNREFLVNFEQLVSDYLNQTRFSGSDWAPPKIKCTFNIYFQSASDEMNYTAQILVGSEREINKRDKKSRMLTILDNSWSFIYERNQPVVYNPMQFNSLASMLDYYAYVIIGMEMDSWLKLGGTPFFSKAFDIVNLAASSRYSSGWERGGGSFNRRDLVEDILAEKYRPMREGVYDLYYYGLDVQFKDVTRGKNKLADFVMMMDGLRGKIDARSVFVKSFFDAKYGEILDNLKDHPKWSELVKILRVVDPPHAGKYEN
ncbi:MAG: DUF4835 family protein [Ignavibacteriaceae bacterium]